MPRRHERRGCGLTSTSRGWTEANIRSSISKSDLRAKPPISNKLVGISSVKLPFPLAALLGVVVLTILVFGAFALLKNTSGGGQAPANELITGSIPRAAPVRKPPYNEQMATFLSPASTELTTLVQSTAVDRRAVPLPRPRPKRL